MKVFLVRVLLNLVMNCITIKKENSTLEEEFFVRCKNYLVPIEVKSSNNKAILVLFQIYILPTHFCGFLIKKFLSNYNY